jgi:WXG100 family type VII secretion target
VWTREAAEAYRIEQARWDQSAAALNDILFRLGNAVRDGADDVAATDRRAATAWGA